MILLDTHVWVRWLAPVSRPLPAATLQVLETDEPLAVSAISCWEIVQLHQRGRIELSLPVARWLDHALQGSGIACLPMTRAIAQAAAELTEVHRDPADRSVIATAIVNSCRLLTLDSTVHAYPEVATLLA